MSLWAVTMVKDEIDVLPYTVTHMVGAGVDGFVIADNLSTDGTWEWLCREVQLLPVKCLLLRDPEVAYYQSAKMTDYYHRASALGAGWVIPFDADEVWYSEDLRRLGDVFGADSDADCLEVNIHNYFPTSSDDAGEANPFKRIVHRDSAPAILAKTAVRAGIDSLVIEQGNHQAHADGPLRVRRSNLAIGHFPWRSPEQFESKVRNGARAYEATDSALMPPEQGDHWRQHGKILRDSGPGALRDVFYEWYHDPAEVELERLPVPWMG